MREERWFSLTFSLLNTLLSEYVISCGPSSTKARVGPGFVAPMAYNILETVLKKENIKLQMQTKVKALEGLWLDNSEGS